MFGVLTWVKIGAVLAVLAAAGGFVWEYRHRGTVIETQQLEIANLKVERAVLETRAQVEAQFQTKAQAVQRKVTNVQKQVDEAVGSGDPGRVIELFKPYRVQPAGQAGHPAPGKGGRPQSKPQ